MFVRLAIIDANFGEIINRKSDCDFIGFSQVLQLGFHFFKVSVIVFLRYRFLGWHIFIIKEFNILF